MEGMDWIDLAQDRDRRRPLWMRELTFVFDKMWVISWLAKNLLDSQEVFFSMEFFLSVIQCTDEDQITRDNITNTRKSHGWTYENPHQVCYFQQRLLVNVWWEILVHGVQTFMAQGHNRSCGLVRGPRAENNNNWYTQPPKCVILTAYT
jgi:hypothetical protein